MNVFVFYTVIIGVMRSADVIQLSVIENDEFYKLKSAAVNDDGIFLLDVGNKTVYHYAMDGSYLRSISGPGQGPGEFIEPNDLIVRGDTLWILGHTLMRVGEFIDGKLSRSIQMRKMPFSFAKIDNKFVVGQVFSTSFMTSYNLEGNLQDSVSFQGAAKDYFKGAPFPIFSTLTHMTSSDTHIYLTYEYKNAIEKYSPDMQLLETRIISRQLKEPIVKDGGNNQWYIDGLAIAKDIQYYQGKIYVLWMAQSEQIQCEGLSRLSIFNENLRHLTDLTLPDCVVGFAIYDDKLFGVCEEPMPRVVIYDLE